MSFDNYLQIPQTSSTAVEEKAIIEKIEQRLIITKRLIQEKRMTCDKLQSHMTFIRAQLRKFYGKDSEIPRYLTPIKDNQNPMAVTERALALIKRTENFIRLAIDIGPLSFGEKRSGRVFIGHGQSPLWRELKDFLAERLGLAWDEFNREAVAGFMTFERISQMLAEAEFAFLIMTAEDSHLDRSLHARENVVHEVGLFQGRLGPKRAIILLEEGCEEFSNIVGLSQIRFPRNHISSTFEEIRKVLERENIIRT